MNGYHGRFLSVDLSSGNIADMPVAENDLKRFIGGSSLSAKLMLDYVKPGMDPLAPENPLVFATGPFTGTAIPMVSRFSVCGISPLTGLWGEATSGGSFPFRLKGAGYDGIFITGKADKPVYLSIEKGRAELRDASHLWGKDSYEAQRAIHAELDNAGVCIAGIGVAGETLTRTASIQNDEGRAVGRCGMGALMGSKMLKAVAVSGTMRPALADSAAVKQIAEQVVDAVRGHFISVAFREYGTLMYMDMGMTLGDVPVKYFQKSIFPSSKLTGHALRQNYAVENYACMGCVIGCGRTVKDVPGIGDVDGPEYETVAALGPLCMNFDWDSILRANYMCNAHGIDTISAGVSIAYAMYLYEKGVLTKERAGMEINWGDSEAILKLLDLMIKNEGIGALLSQGTLAMAREFGRDSGEAAQVKGLEMPMHDARAFHGQAVSYATGPRGACHLKGDYYNLDLGNFVAEYMLLPSERHSSEGKAETAAKYQSLKDLYDSLTLCKFSPMTVTQICNAYQAITGWEMTPADLLKAGDRSIAIKRTISNLLGVTRADDCMPDICMKPLQEGSSAGSVPDMDRMLKEYYTFRKWDWETGRPSKEALEELDLPEAVKVLY
jgi:aldehyde:ferredoxin oxidoreductase